MVQVGDAQQPPAGGRGAQAPQTPSASAPIDLTGYWVSVVNEDWRWRMVTPPKGDYASVPMTDEARKVADTWDVSKDGQCDAYGAAGLMRMPTRLHITWEGDNVLKIETDAGQQTRRLLFDAHREAGRAAPSRAIRLPSGSVRPPRDAARLPGRAATSRWSPATCEPAGCARTACPTARTRS